jgi:hypothetical protein
MQINITLSAKLRVKEPWQKKCDFEGNYESAISCKGKCVYSRKLRFLDPQRDKKLRSGCRELLFHHDNTSSILMKTS